MPMNRQITLEALDRLSRLNASHASPYGVRFFIDSIMMLHVYGAEVAQMNYAGNRSRRRIPCTQAVLDLEAQHRRARDVGKLVTLEHVVSMRELTLMLETGDLDGIIDGYRIGYVTHAQHSELEVRTRRGLSGQDRYDDAGIVLLERP